MKYIKTHEEREEEMCKILASLSPICRLCANYNDKETSCIKCYAEKLVANYYVDLLGFIASCKQLVQVRGDCFMIDWYELERFALDYLHGEQEEE